MAESDIIPHIRLDLAEILRRHDSDIPTAAQEQDFRTGTGEV